MNTDRFILHPLLLLLVLACLMPAFSGCRKKVAVPADAPPQSAPEHQAERSLPAITPAIPLPEPETVEPAPEPTANAEPTSLSLGEASFQAGKYARAAQLFEDHLKKNPASPNRDVVLFRIGLSYAVAEGSGRNMRRAEEALKRLVAEFPASPYKGPAEFILGLQSQVESLKVDIKEKEARIKLLSDELQKLKDIDLQRRPSLPSQ
jgi:hypothetical protein